MHIELYERSVSNGAKTVHLSGLDHEDVAGASLELPPVDVPQAPAFAHELHFIVRMPMGARASPGLGAEEKHGDVDIPMFGSDKLVRASLKRQVLLMDAVHRRLLR
jgi:hypothetical protein